MAAGCLTAPETFDFHDAVKTGSVGVQCSLLTLLCLGRDVNMILPWLGVEYVTGVENWEYPSLFLPDIFTCKFQSQISQIYQVAFIIWKSSSI